MDINYCTTLLFSFSLLAFLNSSLAHANHVVNLQANSYQDSSTKLHNPRYEITYVVMEGRRWLREMSTRKNQGIKRGSRNTDAHAKEEEPYFSLWVLKGNSLESRKEFESSRGQQIHQKDDKIAESMRISATSRRYLKATTSQKQAQDEADQTYTVIGTQDYAPMKQGRRKPVHN